MPDGEVGEMPDRLHRTERLDRALGRAEQIADHGNENEHQRIRVRHVAVTPAHRQQVIRAAAPHRHQHRHAEHDRGGLQPPRQRTEQEMVSAQQRVEQQVGPEREHAQRIGIDRAAEDLRDRVIEDAQRQRRKPHAHRVVHVEAGNGDLPQAMLIPRQRRDDRDHAGPQHAAHRVPVGKIDVLGGASRHRADQIPAGHQQRGEEYQPDRPRPLAVFQITPVVAQLQRDGAGDGGKVEQRQADPGQLDAVQLRAATARGHVIRQPDQADAGPAVKRVVGVDRPQSPEGQVLRRPEVRRPELERQQQPHRRGKQQPAGGRNGVCREHGGQCAIIFRAHRRMLCRDSCLHRPSHRTWYGVHAGVGVCDRIPVRNTHP